MKKILSRKGIILIIMPAFTIFLQGFVRYILDKDFNTLGITLAALGLGQILPFLYSDHFISNKILGISAAYEIRDKELIVTYSLKANVPKEEIEGMKNNFFIAIFMSLGLFLITIYLGLTESILQHILFGSLNCWISWYFLIFK